MTGMLASVTNLSEACLVLRAGTDIIDLKQPSNGALGALDTNQVANIRAKIDRQNPISATIGDLPMVPETIVEAVLNMAATGVDYIKIGFFPGGQWGLTIEALATTATDQNDLIAVVFADTTIQVDWIDHLADAGFRGVMIDTMDKSKGSLTEICPKEIIESFVAKSKDRGLLCGLAGSLKKVDIPTLLPMMPDYLGFRGALCVGSHRTNKLDETAIHTIRALINGDMAKHRLQQKSA